MTIVTRFRALACAAIACATVAACIAREEPADAAAQASTELDRDEWLEKAAKALRNGDGLGPRDDRARLRAMTRSEVVDLWMRDGRFGDTVLAFNLFFIGRAVSNVKSPNAPDAGPGFTYDPVVFRNPQAVMAAKAALEGGDYFDLFSPSPALIPPPNPTFPSGAVDTSGAFRRRVIDEMQAAIDVVAADRASACERFTQAGLDATNRLRLLGFKPALAIRSTWFVPPTARYPRTVDCSAESTMSRDDLVASMRTVRSALDRIWAEVEAHPIPRFVRSVADLPAIALRADGLPLLVPALNEDFFFDVPSSSTNFQRKRAAHVLRTYFCDDLTPLSLPDPGDGGAEAAHASNPSCQACHYRLDPIGALFRYSGSDGSDESDQRRILFNDGVTFTGADYDRYLDQWRNPDGSFRAGYWVLGRDGRPQREPGWTDADGDRIEGLWSYLPRSSVVKRCLVKRLADFVLGSKQVYDREWLDEISRPLRSGPGSGAAFRSVVKALVLSNTFATHDPRPDTCYDLPANAPANRSPCAIAHVVATHCTSCHDSLQGPGRLDLTQWKDVGGGTFSWAHLDEHGTQLPRAETLRRILARITSLDPDRRMPLLRTMPVDDFATLKTWLGTSLSTSPP